MSRYNVLNYFPPGRIPQEVYDSVPDHDLEEFIFHVQKAHAKRGKNVSREEVLNRIDKHSEAMGLTPAQGRGLFGKIWSGVKNAVANAGSQAWNAFSNDPIGTIQKVGSVLGHVIDAIPAEALPFAVA